MRSGALMRTLTILGLGLAGLVGGHALGYAIAFPDDAHRAALLDTTGHGYMPSVSRLALMLGIAAVITGIAAGYMHRPRAARPSFARVALWLVGLQCGGFIGLEVVERVLAGAPMSSLSLVLLVVGLLSQAVVAVVLALLIAGLRRLGAALRTTRLAGESAGRIEPVWIAVVLPFSRTRLRDRVRGPPLLQSV